MLLLLLLPAAACTIIRIPLQEIPAYPDAKNNTSAYYDMVYVAEVLVGPDKQSFRLLFDTGSAPMWLLSSQICGNDCGQKNVYNISESFCSLNKAIPFQNQYGAGETRGCYVKETVAIDQLVVQHQEVGLLHAVDDSILKFDMDGILGLSLPGVNRYPLLLNLFHQYHIEPSFTFHLRHHNNTFLIGASDNDTYFGPLNYIPVIAEELDNNNPVFYHWNLNVDNVIVGNVFSLSENVKVMLDTGTANIGVPFKDAVKLLRYLDSMFWDEGELITLDDEKFEYQIPCSIPEETYAIHLYIGDLKFSLGKDELLLKIRNGSDLQCRIRTLIAPFWVLGTSFHKNHYVHYDMGRHLVGIARYSD